MTSKLPGMKPIKELGARRPHGTRLRYMSGCKCFKCRMANSTYEHERSKARAAGESDHIISAREVIAHIRELSRQGVGYKQVAAAASLARSTVAKLLNGKRSRIRAQAARRILAVTVIARADGVTVSAKGLWMRINRLLEEGYTKKYLAQRLGRGVAIQFNKHRVTVRTDADVRRLYRELMGLAPLGAGSPAPRAYRFAKARRAPGRTAGRSTLCVDPLPLTDPSPFAPSVRGEITSSLSCQSHGSMPFAAVV